MHDMPISRPLRISKEVANTIASDIVASPEDHESVGIYQPLPEDADSISEFMHYQ
jgi:hypothetical protein